MSARLSSDLDLTLHTLNYATRLLASELDDERVTLRALDIVADFGRSRQVALLEADEGSSELVVAGLYSAAGLVSSQRRIPVRDSLLAETILEQQPRSFRLSDDAEVPLPEPGEPGQEECYVVPLIGCQRRILGLLTLARSTDDPLSEIEQQAMTVVATLIAVSLENARLFRLATVDGLTGLYVRRYFELRLAEECARVRRQGGGVAILMTDIDFFKQFNDTYGHQQGDRVLREMADLCRDVVRSGYDIACRYGGEEFVIILPATDLAGAAEVAERLRRRAEAHGFAGQAEPLQVTLSVGVAAATAEALPAGEELVRRADEALYDAKQSGRNRVRAWSPHP